MQLQRFRLRAVIVGANHDREAERHGEAFAKRRRRHRLPVPITAVAVFVAFALVACGRGPGRATVPEPEPPPATPALSPLDESFLQDPPWSRPSDLETEIIFVNETATVIILRYVNDKGEIEPYGSVVPGATRTQHTFSGHIWLVLDGHTRTRLAVFEAIGEPARAVITPDMLPEED